MLGLALNQTRRRLKVLVMQKGDRLQHKSKQMNIEKNVPLAYLCNVFMNPIVKGYFDKTHVPVSEDIYALSEMLQWIWRSQIRDMKPITILSRLYVCGLFSKNG